MNRQKEMSRAMQQSRQSRRKRGLYNADTDPALPTITQPIPAYYLPGIREPWHRRMAQGLQRAVAFIVRKIIFLLNFVLTLLLLLLISRLVLVAFALHSSLFATWVFQLSTYLLLPFNNLLPTFPYQGIFIDSNTLVAIFTYAIITRLITSFLVNLMSPPQKKTGPL